MFALYEKVVYPGHGVAEIQRIIDQKVGGVLAQFFELVFINKDMTILVPVQNVASVGLRKLSSSESITMVYKLLAEPAVKVNYELTASNWNKRNKEYQFKIRTGNISEICKIYRDLKHIARHKELSFGEKNLLNQTEGLLVEEIALVANTNPDIITENLRSLCNQHQLSELPLPANTTVSASINL